jgi:hypothetical protein
MLSWMVMLRFGTLLRSGKMSTMSPLPQDVDEFSGSHVTRVKTMPLVFSR